MLNKLVPDNVKKAGTGHWKEKHRGENQVPGTVKKAGTGLRGEKQVLDCH